MPVIVINEAAQAVPLAKALLEGGIPVIEITLRTEAALDAVSAVAAEVPEMIVGVGTVTQPHHFSAAKTAGARFAISPGLTSSLLEASRDSDLPYLPGVFSPSEAMSAYESGFRHLKLFPAKQAGGVGMLKALASPLPDLNFCPTGGIDESSYLEYARLPNVACVGGSWIAPAGLIEAGDWGAITSLAREAVHQATSLDKG